MSARVRMLKGERLSFDDESKALYDAVAPTYPDSHFQAVLDRLEKRFPGIGSLVERYDAWRRAFVIPREKLDTVFQAAIGACRERTLAHVALPAGEQFTVEYVTNKSWSGYNWYQGDFRSLIQVNTDLPIYIDRAIDLACHEGYPGPSRLQRAAREAPGQGSRLDRVHRLSAFLAAVVDRRRHRELRHRGRVSRPASAWRSSRRRSSRSPGSIRQARRGVLRRAWRWSISCRTPATRRRGATSTAQIDAAAATAWLERYALMPHDRAAQRVRFFDQYRSYVINYNLGKDLVRTYIESRGGTPDHADRRWQEFEKLLSSPRLPSGLR